MKKLNKKNIFDIYPLTEGQQGILFETIKGSPAPVYAIRIFIGYDFLLDEAQFRQTWKQVLENNELLRAVIRWRKLSKPVAVILKEANDRINIVHYENLHFQSFSSHAKNFSQNNLSIEDKVFSVTLHQINASRSLVEIQSHHIVQDGWSTSILVNEFIGQYQNKKLTTEKVHYRKCLSDLKECTDRSLAQPFWTNYLEGVERHSLVENHKSEIGGVGEFDATYSTEFHHHLSAEAQKHKVSLSTIFHLGWAMALRNYQDADDVLFGSVVAGRSASVRGMDQVIGNFINTLPFRAKFDGTLTVKEALRLVQEQLAARTDFEHYAIGQIKKFARVEADTDMFDSVLVIENYPFDEAVLYAEPLKASYTEVKESSSYPLDISIRTGQEIQVNVKYQPAKIADNSVQHLIASFRKALDFILQSADQRISDYTAVSEEEKHKILKVFNQPVDEASLPDSSLVGLFDTQAVKSPESTALVASGMTLSYRQLQHEANKLACKLTLRGVVPGEIVGVCASHSVERVIALLAVLKVGGAFMPLRTTESLEKISEVLDSCSVSKLLVEATFDEAFYHHCSFNEKLFIDTDTSEIEEGIEWKNYSTNRSDLAYVLMTSGSTGAPKAVMVEHRSLQNTVHWFKSEYNLSVGTRILQLTDYTFDPSLEDIFGGLLAGAEIHLPSEAVLTDTSACYRYLVRHRINLVNYVPSVLHEILGHREKIESLRTVISGGEALSEIIKEELLAKGYILYNNYGPTEITVDCLYSRCDQRKVSLGTSISNSYCLLLDANHHLTPVGRVGEICIGGLGVARGYLNDAALTARKFISDPYHPGRILYKTGDYGLWQEDGTVRYLGRKDRQVKINGIRVELSQVTAEIDRMPEVMQSEVIVSSAAKRLVAFVALQKDKEVSEDTVKIRLRKTLPAYLIPRSVCFLKKFPLTNNGKTDTRALEEIYTNRPKKKAAGLKEASQYEHTLANIWREILDPEELDADKSFFELGGDSLGLMKANNRINDHFNLDLPISTYFSYPSIHLLSQHIQGLIKEDRSDVLPVKGGMDKRVSATKNRLLTIKRNR